MLTRIKILIRNDARLLLANGLFCLSLLIFQLSRTAFSTSSIGPALAMSVALFLLLAVATGLSRSLFYDQLTQVFLDNLESDNPGLIKPFVLVREISKTVVGVSLSLGWLAGLLLVAGAGWTGGLKFFAGLSLSLAVLALMYGLVRGCERLRLP